MRRNVFVIGLDDFNLAKLQGIPGAHELAFRPLFHRDEIRGLDEYPVDDLLREATCRLEGFGRSVDAIIGYWDFPVSEMLPILRDRFRLPSPTLESILRCNHKSWSRLELESVAPGTCPAFHPVDPWDPDAFEALDLDLPFWLKPVRSFRSYLGFRIGSRADWDAAIGEIRDGIRRISEPFERILERVDLPDEIARLGGSVCIAEEIVRGHQCTLEGYSHRGEANVYGIVDSFRYPNRSSFFRYEYPSRVPRRVQSRMVDVAKRFVQRVGYEGAPFNMEFFYDHRSDRTWMLEMNTRISQSHTDLFEKVDGTSNHAVAVDLALGRDPRPAHRQGAFRRAAKCFLRHFSDGVVTRVPDAEELSRIEAEIPGVTVLPEVEEGTRLSDLADQDAYSYELAVVFVAADSSTELLQTYREAIDRLDIRVSDVRPVGAATPPVAGRAVATAER